MDEVWTTHLNHPSSYYAMQASLDRYQTIYGLSVGRIKGRSFFGFGGPVGFGDRIEVHLRSLMERFDQVHMAYVDPRLASLARRVGYHVCPLGDDVMIALASFNLQQPGRRKLRRSLRQVRRSDLRVEEVSAMDGDRGLIGSLYQEWMHKKPFQVHEQGGLIHPLGFPRHARLFTASWGDQVVGFRLFYPLFRFGIVCGYIAMHAGFRPEAPTFTGDALMLTAIDAFKSEEKSWLHLGLAPFSFESRIDRPQPFLRIMSTIGDAWFSFAGIRRWKGFFKGRAQPAYLCSTQAWPLRAMWQYYRWTVARKQHVFGVSPKHVRSV